MDPITWVYIIVMIISLILAVVMQPKPVVPKPAAFADFDFPQFDEGTEQCVFFGDCWTGDWMVLGVGNYRTIPIYTKGGK